VALPLNQLQGVPQPLVILLELLLEKDPARRLQSPAELLGALPTVTAAMEAGCHLLRTVRVLVSSASDVQKERHLAERVMRLVAAEFNVPVSVSHAQVQRLAEANDGSDPQLGADHGRWMLCPYFWDDQRFGPDTPYPGQVPNPADFDLVTCLLWARLDTALAPALSLPDGSPPSLGAGYELAWAVDHANKARAVPPLRVYRNGSQPTPPLEPKGSATPCFGNGTRCRRFLRDGRSRARKTWPGHATAI
jgi:hypothetical protein